MNDFFFFCICNFYTGTCGVLVIGVVVLLGVIGGLVSWGSVFSGGGL